MLFNSFEFVVFFIAFLAMFLAAPGRGKPVLLLIASYLFYAGWRPSYVVLLIFTTLVDYTGALVIDGARTRIVRRIAVTISLGINLGILATLKYLDFAISSVVGTAGFFGVELPDYALHFVLPVGISFYTFQSIGYTLDVYLGRMRAERSLLYYAIYVAFFPQLVAGPIERAQHMLAQYKAPPRTSPERIATGLWLIGYGLFKKMCIADLVSPVVTTVYSDPGAYNGSYTLLATILFSIQIYCDFSDYSDIAIGVARMMGYDLMFNFRQPYFSATLTQFWRAWHISLTTWFRDFLYMPLGGNRVPRILWVRNVLLVFVVSGIWHGAAWTFAIWGLIHGVALACEGLIERRNRPSAAPAAGGAANPGLDRRPLAPALLTTPVTLAIVLVGWVFFRARSLPDALAIISSWASPGGLSYGTFKVIGLGSFEILLVPLQLAILFTVDALIKFRPELLARLRGRPVLATAAGVALLFDILLFGVFGRVDFIYFQF